MSKPSIQEWDELYELAIKFNELQPWEWMTDSDVFGVKNPANEKIGYCCIMGMLGEHFALAIYLGREGLESLRKIRSGEITPSSPDAMHVQRCLQVSYEDKGFLEGRDLQVIEKLGLEFEGRNWPRFRSYRPGYHPWFLTGEEVRYLALALPQAIGVSLRFIEDPQLLDPPKEGQYLVRVPQEENGLSWRDEWLNPGPFQKEKITPKPVDKDVLGWLKRKISQRQGVWEIDFFYSPSPIKEGERPYYPYVVLCGNHFKDFILGSNVIKTNEMSSKFPEELLRLIREEKILPNKVLVKKREGYKLLESLTSKIGIELEEVDSLPVLEEARKSMEEFFKGKDEHLS